VKEAGAAVVAAQLLAFYKEPARYRARLIHSREPLSGGLLVFRFAHGKFSHALMRDLTVAERERLRVAASFFIRQVCLWEGATHYQVLCVPTAARRETIKEHYHGLIALLHPDRQAATAERWPAGAAHRVNEAYGVLFDDAQRREYDAGFAAAAPSPLEDGIAGAHRVASSRNAIRGFTAARIRMRKPVLAFGAVAASLFCAQVWWFGDMPHEYATLLGAAPVDLSSRWVRESRSGVERPRFIAATEPHARGSEAAVEAPVPFLTPLWRALSTRTASTPAPVRQPEEIRVASVEAVPASATRTAPVIQAELPRTEPQSLRADASTVVRSESEVIAQASTAASPAKPALYTPAPAGAVSSGDMEILVARLVTYYEGGDLERLLGLYDGANISFWEANRIRHDFEEFFRTTRGRRLRLNRVSWETAALSARARGDAALVAEYYEPAGGKLERNVELEMDVVVRDGQPRIARLSLFPHAR
jgi:hypothetical protein